MDKFGVSIGLKIDLKNEKDPKKMYPIYVYIGQGSKRRYINTRVKCRLKNFNGENVFGTLGCVRDNENIKEVIDDVRSQVYHIIAHNNDFSFELYDKEIKGEQITAEKKGLHDDFLMYFNSVGLNYKEKKTQYCYLSVGSMVKKFGKIKSFKDVTVKNIQELDKFMEEQGLKNSSIKLYHSKMIRVIHKAIEDGYKIDNPYSNYKQRKTQKGKLKYLEEDDLRKIFDYRPKYKIEQQVRDLFILQAYTGLAYADAIKISQEDIKVIRGKKYIVGKRKKTHQEYSIRVFPEVEQILEKYNYNLRLFHYETYNDRLKSMAKILGIREDLSSHMARHTFATIALNRGVPLAIVAKMLGHSSTQCTEIYAQYLQSTIQREGYDKLEDIFG